MFDFVNNILPPNYQVSSAEIDGFFNELNIVKDRRLSFMGGFFTPFKNNQLKLEMAFPFLALAAGSLAISIAAIVGAVTPLVSIGFLAYGVREALFGDSKNAKGKLIVSAGFSGLFILSVLAAAIIAIVTAAIFILSAIALFTRGGATLVSAISNKFSDSVPSDMKHNTTTSAIPL